MSPGEKANYTYFFPLGLAYISSVLRRAGHQVSCRNLNHDDGPTGELVADFLREDDHDVLCTGGISTIYREIRSIVEAARRACPSTKVILGGGLISSEPELMYGALHPDFQVLGEGEETIEALVDCLANGGDPSTVAGIGLGDVDGRYIQTPPRDPIKDLDSLPLPDFQGLGFDTYLEHLHPSDHNMLDIDDHPRMYPIVCSRSCPYLCTFCYHPLGNRYRQRSLDSILEELSVMVPRHHINIIGIYDDLFTHRRDRLHEFCARIKELFARIPWRVGWFCQMRVDGVDDEILEMMRDAGCYGLGYGFESFSPAVLASMKKQITPAKIEHAVTTTMAHRLSLQANFIFGDRAETLATAEETLSYWRRTRASGILLSFINPYPGSAIYEHCLARGIIAERLDFIANHICDVFNMSDTMTDDEFQRLKVRVATAELRHTVYAVPRAVTRAPDGTFTLRFTCPHCRETVTYGNYLIEVPGNFRFPVYCRACRKRYFAVSRLNRLKFRVVSVLYALVPEALMAVLIERYRRVHLAVLKRFPWMRSIWP